MTSANRFLRALHRPVDAASLAVFRVVFGIVMLVEIGRYWGRGWIREYFVEPKHFFSYPLFDWVHPLPPVWLTVQFDALALAAMCIVLGLFTRIAATVFAVLFAWWFLSDQTNYLNHFYLITLVSFLLVFVPTDRAFSLDARYRRAPGTPRSPETETVPAWALWLVRFQVGVPYFFGGIAKLNADWFAGEPMRMWLAERKHLPWFGSICTEEWCVWFFVVGGLVLDLGIVPALLWRKTRPFAFAASLAFHGTNAVIFTIGIFPWLMMAATSVYFEPDWPRRVLARVLRRPVPGPKPAPMPAAVEITPARGIGMAALGGWVALQVFLPLRHFLYPGNASWTEEGHLYAWHMKLRDKTGYGEFTARDPATGKTWRIDPRNYLTKRQESDMYEHPDEILQFAHLVAEEHAREGKGRLEVRAKVWVRLNGRKPELIVDPEVDLAAQPRSIGRWSWIRPLTEPLRAPAHRGT
jgi:vitamin K-dependent gamma-carboxylase